MQEFKRARSAEQKNQRMADIKKATADLFRENPYHEITLTTIAERLGWSRANLYKYVTTKEEIFLDLAADARDEYFEALLGAFPKKACTDLEALAKEWAHIADKNRDWAVYGTILMTIIEANVTIERLKVFKKGYYDWLPTLSEHFSCVLGIKEESFPTLLNTIHNQAVGLAGNCANNPLVAEAIKQLNIKRTPVNFQEDMADFIYMCVNHWKEKAGLDA